MLNDEIVARIPAWPDQEIHLRIRRVDNATLPDQLDWALYSLQDGSYSMATQIPADPSVLDAMSAALQTAKSRL